MDTKFLDAAMVALSRHGPIWTVDLFGDKESTCEPLDTWAKRVAEQALALATAREKLLLDVQTGGATVPPDDPDFYVDCPKCEAERRKTDERDRACADAEHRHAVAENERDEARAEVERLKAENADLRVTLSGRTFSEAQPTVCTVDVDAASKEIERAAFDTGAVPTVGNVAAVLRKHTRAADPEALAEVFYGRRGKDGRPRSEAVFAIDLADAKLALSHLGIALAEKPAAPPPPPGAQPAPTIALTDCGKAAEEIAHEAENLRLHNERPIGRIQAAGILRKHVSAASPEALAMAIEDARAAWKVADGTPPMMALARAALAHLGVALAEPTGPRTVTGNEPWTDQDRKHGRHFVAPGVAGFQGPDHERHWLAEKPAAPAPGGFVLDVARVLAAYDAPSSMREGLRSAVEEISRQLFEHALNGGRDGS